MTEYQVIVLDQVDAAMARQLNQAAAEGWRLHTIVQEPSGDRHVGWPPRAVMVRESDDAEEEWSSPTAQAYIVQRMAAGRVFLAGMALDYLEAREIYQALMEARTNHIRQHGQMTPDEAYRIIAPDGRMVLSFQWPEEP